MGLFSGIKSRYKKSEAAVIVQNLLENQAGAGLLALDPAKLANKLVATVWESKPDIFNGKFGQRPHKIAVAASALANGICLFEDSNPNKNALVFSLSNILEELGTNGGLYPFNSLDQQLIQGAMSVIAEIGNELSGSPVGNERDRVDYGILDIQAKGLSMEFYDAFCDHFNSIAPEMLGTRKNSDSLEALSEFATLITMIEILNQWAANELDSSTNSIKKKTGEIIKCAAAQFDLICKFEEYTTDNEHFFKIQKFVKSKIKEHTSMIAAFNSNAISLGLESYIHDYLSYQEPLNDKKIEDYIESRVQAILGNRCITKSIETRLEPEKKKDTEKITQLLEELQNQMNNMVSAFYWEREREKQTVILSKLSNHMLVILEVVGPEEFESFYDDADTMGKTAMILAAVMSSNTQLMDAFDGYKGIDFDVEMDKADTYRGYMYEKYAEATP
jgi:hypothetical protein